VDEEDRTPGAGDGDRTILVGVDGSEHSRLAVKWAADEAAASSATVRVVYAGPGEPKHVPGWYEEGPHEESAAQAVLDDAVGLVVARHPWLTVRRERFMDIPAAALVGASAQADLLVVGARGVGRLKRLLVGSVSEQCMDHALCPVVIVRPGFQEESTSNDMRRLVVGIDGSRGSEHALRWALREARVRGASVEGVFSWQYPPSHAIGADSAAKLESWAREVTQSASSIAEGCEPTVSFTASARFDATVIGLLDASEDADLLVVGARGHGGFLDSLLGSVARQCALYATSSVVIVRP
jgi:nucleotide-binding universal stress UspA family protein